MAAHNSLASSGLANDRQMSGRTKLRMDRLTELLDVDTTELMAEEVALESWDIIEGSSCEEKYVFPEPAVETESSEEEIDFTKDRWYQCCVYTSGEEGLREHKRAEAKLREERLQHKEAVEMKFWIADQRQLW